MIPTIFRTGLICFALASMTSKALSQVVQLPSIRQFSYSGGVLVPDQGSTYLGGNRTSATGSRSRGIPGFGPMPQSQFGGIETSSGVSVSATIIDHQEIDRQLLGEDPRRIAWHARHRHAASPDEQIEEIKSLVRNARSLHLAGRGSASRATYDLAIDRMVRLRQHPSAPEELVAKMLAYAEVEYSKLYGPLPAGTFAANSFSPNASRMRP
ncbi:hypothetical protein [Neorhodopirellula pilleata]|uniref:Uncharacterized protein n=1 Tax=Neorhodopirellula pilleata TaxID=2714738 RepID=A0A5C6ADN2_9BACT|nr:hypothetical protein [Neorhodopirellula pilleata]TWT97517.1 hypothetical protein Pla100_26710 [Neorhodopirellula pilleata]